MFTRVPSGRILWLMKPRKTITFTLRTECDKCGDMIPVNGPLQHVTCGSCQAEYDLTPGLWADQVASAAEGYTIMNNPYTCNATQDPSPMCPVCEEHFPFDDAAVEGDEVIHCPGCGRAIHSYPAPEWLSKELPAVFHVIGGEREKRRTEEEGLKRRARKSRDRGVTFIIVGAIVAFVGLVLAVSAYQ